jgi:hypothetical protein
MTNLLNTFKQLKQKALDQYLESGFMHDRTDFVEMIPEAVCDYFDRETNRHYDFDKSYAEAETTQEHLFKFISDVLFETEGLTEEEAREVLKQHFDNLQDKHVEAYEALRRKAMEDNVNPDSPEDLEYHYAYTEVYETWDNLDNAIYLLDNEIAIFKYLF